MRFHNDFLVLSKREKNKEKKTGPKKKEIVPFCKEKKSFVKAIDTGVAPRWASTFRTKKSPSN